MHNTYSLLEAKRITFADIPADIRPDVRSWFKSENTYLSNKAEGSSLTREETALVVETGMTSGSHTWQEYLQAVNYSDAWEYIQGIAGQKKPSEITENDISRIHRLLTFHLDLYAGLPRENAALEPIMKTLMRSEKQHPLELASAILKDFQVAQPFRSANIGIAHLVANLILLSAGYPCAFLADSELIPGLERSFQVLHDRASQGDESKKQHLTIGELARLTDESPATLRYWTNEGLIPLSKRRHSGYRLYDERAISRVQEIRRLQHTERRTLAEMKRLFIVKKAK